MDTGIGKQVYDDLVQALRITIDHDRVFNSLGAPIVIGACHVCIRESIPNNLRKIDRFLL